MHRWRWRPLRISVSPSAWRPLCLRLGQLCLLRPDLDLGAHGHHQHHPHKYNNRIHHSIIISNSSNRTHDIKHMNSEWKQLKAYQHHLEPVNSRSDRINIIRGLGSKTPSLFSFNSRNQPFSIYLRSTVMPPRDIHKLHPCRIPFLAPAIVWIEKNEPVVRWRDCVELFAGQHEITTAVREKGLKGIAYDVKYTPHSDWNNIITDRGFQRALQLVLEVRCFGSVWAAPVCGPWVFICRAGTGRTAWQPEGDRSNKRVKDANVMVIHVVIILLVAWYRNLNMFTEQPQGSLMGEFTPMREFISSCLPLSCSTFLGAFGAPSAKPVLIRSTAMGVQTLARKRPQNLERLADNINGRVNGKSAKLKESSAYPKEFGQYVAAIIKKASLAPSIRELFWDGAANMCARSLNVRSSSQAGQKRPRATSAVPK